MIDQKASRNAVVLGIPFAALWWLALAALGPRLDISAQATVWLEGFRSAGAIGVVFWLARVAYRPLLTATVVDPAGKRTFLMNETGTAAVARWGWCVVPLLACGAADGSPARSLALALVVLTPLVFSLEYHHRARPHAKDAFRAISEPPADSVRYWVRGAVTAATIGCGTLAFVAISDPGPASLWYLATLTVVGVLLVPYTLAVASWVADSRLPWGLRGGPFVLMLANGLGIATSHTNQALAGDAAIAAFAAATAICMEAVRRVVLSRQAR